MEPKYTVGRVAEGVGLSSEQLETAARVFGLVEDIYTKSPPGSFWYKNIRVRSGYRDGHYSSRVHQFYVYFRNQLVFNATIGVCLGNNTVVLDVFRQGKWVEDLPLVLEEAVRRSEEARNRAIEKAKEQFLPVEENVSFWSRIFRRKEK